jgi:hypothetical protein
MSRWFSVKMSRASIAAAIRWSIVPQKADQSGCRSLRISASRFTSSTLGALSLGFELPLIAPKFF